MKRLRRLGFLLLLLSCLLPWSVAWVNYVDYAEADLLVRKHLSAADEESLLSVLHGKFRDFSRPGEQTFQPAISSSPVPLFQMNSFLPAATAFSVLRC